MGIERLKIEVLRLDFQHAECLIEGKIRQIMQQISAGESLPPLVVRFDGKSYFIQDGFHRLEAARRRKISELDAEVSPGTLEDMEAEFHKMLDQLKRGLRRTIPEIPH